VRSGVDGSLWNRLEVQVVGDTVTLFLNGSVAAQYREADYRGGTVGFFVGGNNNTDLSVEFDNFALYRKRLSRR
jgi:hypothetical protein